MAIRARAAAESPSLIVGTFTRIAQGLWPLRGLVYALISVITLFDETLDQFPPSSLALSTVYESFVGPFRIVDFLVLFVFLVTLGYTSLVLAKPMRWDHPLRRGFLIWGAALGIAILTALLRGDRAFGIFFWKNLVLGTLFFFVLLNAFTSIRQLNKLLSLMAWVLWVKAVVLLVLYVAGQGVDAGDEVGAKVTIWSYPAMVLFSLTAVYWLGRTSKWESKLWLLFRLLPFVLVVVLSTRRGPILLMALGVLLVWAVILRPRDSLKSTTAVLALLAIAVIAASAFSEQLALSASRLGRLAMVFELDPTSNDKAKLLEYLDAINNISKHPLLGVGLQGTYESDYFADKSWSGVHCGLLEAWLRMGLLGAAAYFFIVYSYGRLLRCYFVALRARAPGLLSVALLGAIYLGMTLVFVPGPYVFQSALTVFLCFGILNITTRELSLTRLVAAQTR